MNDIPSMLAPLALACVRRVLMNPNATMQYVNPMVGLLVVMPTCIGPYIEHAPLFCDCLGKSNNTQLSSGIIGLASITVKTTG